MTRAERPDRVLVTGAAGFIGSHLVAALAAQDRRIRALVRNGEDASALERLGAEVVTGDVRAPASVKAAMHGCRTVFHLAAATGRRRLSRRGFLAINVGGTANVARAAVLEGVERLVLASTTSVYGLVRERRIDEDSPLRPGSRYARSKASAERVALDLWRREGLHVSVARITNVFGRGAWEWLDLVERIDEGRFGLVGPGTNRTHPAVVSDIVDGLILCESRGASGRTYLLAGPDTVSLRTLLSELASALGVPPPVEEVSRWSLEVYRRFRRLFPLVADERFPRFDRVTFFLGDRFFDLSRARHELGYSPQARLEDGVQETVRWYRERGSAEAARRRLDAH